MDYPKAFEEARRTGHWEALRAEVNSIEWWHSIDLGPELGKTPGREPSPRLRDTYMHIPEDLSGMSVLDIGAWDGLYSFVAEERGAARVVAVDLYEARGTAAWGTLFPSRRGIDFARMARNSRVQVFTGDICEGLRPTPLGRIYRFDVVFLFGVLYHLQDPVGGLRNVFRLVKPGGLLIVETHLDMLAVKRPAMAFYEGAENGNDPTNWVGPNVACVEAMLRTVGFVDVAFQGGINLNQTWPLENVNYGRGAFHARAPWAS